MINLSRKHMTLYWIIGIFITLCILGGIQADRFSYTSVPAEISYAETFVRQQDGQGILEEGRELSLKKGEYTLEADLFSELPEDTLVVRAKNTVSEDNTAEKMLAWVSPEAGTGRVTLQFELEQDYDHVTVALLGSEETFARSALYGYSLVSNKLVYQDTVFLLLFWIGLLVITRILFFCRKDTGRGMEIEWTSRLKKTLFFLSMTVLVSLPLFTDFLADSHDLGFHLNRIEGIATALSSGQFPVRVNPVFNGGSGYLSEVMYPGLLLYIPAFLRLCGVSLLLSFKMYCVIINLLTAVISYTAFSKVTDSHRIGILSSVFYTFALYRINNLFCRGAIGEWTAMAFLPLVLWGLWEVFYKEEKKWPVLVLGLTLVFQSHLISMLLCLMFCGVFGIFGIRRLRKASRSIALCKAALLTVLLNSYTIVPMLYFMKKGMAIAGQERMIGDYAAYLPQVFSQFIYSDSFAKELGTVQGEMPVTVGCIFLFGIFLFLYAAYYRQKTDASQRKLGTLFLAGGLAAVLLSTNLFPWNLLQSVPKIGRLFGMIQFPFRFLMFAVLCLAPVAAIAVSAVWQKRTVSVAAVVLAVCFLSALYGFDGYLSENETLMKDKFDTCIDGRLGQDYVNYDYYDRQTDWQAAVNMDKRVLSNDAALSVSNLKKEGVTVQLQYSGAIADTPFLDLPLTYIDGYEAKDMNSGASLAVGRGDNSRVRVFLPDETEGRVKVFYKGISLFCIFDWLSALTAAAWAGFYVWKKRMKNR